MSRWLRRLGRTPLRPTYPYCELRFTPAHLDQVPTEYLTAHIDAVMRQANEMPQSWWGKDKAGR